MYFNIKNTLKNNNNQRKKKNVCVNSMTCRAFHYFTRKIAIAFFKYNIY